MSIIKRLQNLAGITLTEGKEFSSEKNYADKSESELQACKKELKAIQAITSKASFKWKDAQTEIEKVDAALDALKDKSKKEEVKESLNEAAWDVFLNGKKIDTVFDSETDAAKVKRSLVDHDGYDSGITVKKAKKLKESKFDSVELRLPASWASALINGDSSGLSDEEEAELDNWVEWASAEYNINAGQPVDVSDEPEFASRHDASPDVLATDVLTYTYFVNESVNDTLEEAKEGSLWVLKVAEPGSDSFGIQFSGTRSECADEWRDVKKDWPKGSKHKIERHVEESVDSEEDTLTEETSNTREEVLKNHIAYHKENMGRLEKNSTSYKDHKKALEKYEAELKGLEESVQEAHEQDDWKAYLDDEDHAAMMMRREKELHVPDGERFDADGNFRPEYKSTLDKWGEIDTALEKKRIESYGPEFMKLAGLAIDYKRKGDKNNYTKVYDRMYDLARDKSGMGNLDDMEAVLARLGAGNPVFEESASDIAARIIQEVDGTKTPEVDYQNGPKENSGIKDEQKKTIRIPSDVRAEVNKRIGELNAAIAKYDEKGYNDKSIKAQAVECLEQLMKDLSTNDLEGVKKAQIYLGTLMSPLTDFFPPQIINWLANAYNPLVKESHMTATEEEPPPRD